MPEIILSETPTTAASSFDKTKKIPTTATAVITPSFSSIDRVAGPPEAPINFNITQLDAPGTGTRDAVRGFLQGRRPYFGLLFPRGYYNK